MNRIWRLIKQVMAGFFLVSFFLLGLVWLAGLWMKAKLADQNPPPGQLVDVGGFKMHLFCAGEGSPTVILEHGLNDFSVTWAKVQPEVARNTRVCSYDRAGMGWSEASPAPRTNQIMVEELHTLLVNADIKPPYVLVGHSFGGINLRLFAHQYPGEAVGIVLVDSAHEQQNARLPFLKESERQFIGQFRSLATMSAFGLVALSPGSIPNRGLPEQAYRQYQAVLATTSFFDNAVAETSAFYDSTLAAPESVGKIPLIVLSHGLPDTSVGVVGAQQYQFEQEWAKMQAELLELSSNSKQIIAEKSQHNIQLDQPDLVIEAILDLVKENKR